MGMGGFGGCIGFSGVFCNRNVFDSCVKTRTTDIFHELSAWGEVQICICPS